MRLSSAGVVALAMVSGCANHPVLLRHYQALNSTTSAPSEIGLSVFPANPKAVDSAPVVLGLTERGQAELIRSLAAHLPAKSDPSKLVALLQETGDPDPKRCAWASKTSLSKRLVFTVLGTLAKPADRIDKLDIRLTLVEPSRAAFASWDRFDSAYGTYDIGSAKYTQSDKVTVKPTAGAGLAKVVDVGYESTSELEETAKYAIRRLSVGGALSENTARLVQEGAPNINLFGSSSAVVSLKLPASTAGDGVDVLPVYALKTYESGKSLAPEEVAIERCLSQYPPSSAPILVTVGGTATLREVSSGDGTVSEGDDSATFRTVPLSTSNVVLAGNLDLQLQLFGLAQCDANARLDQCQRLKIEEVITGQRLTDEVLLRSPEAAAELRRWLVERTAGKPLTSLGGIRLGMAGKDDQEASNLSAISNIVATKLRVVRLFDNNRPKPEPKK